MGMQGEGGRSPRWRWLLPLAWMGMIFQASATPDLKAVPLVRRLGLLPAALGPAGIDLLELLLRKAAHMVTFGILALLLRWALAGQDRAEGRGLPGRQDSQGRHVRQDSGWASRLHGWVRSPQGWALGLSVLYAAADEFHQRFVPGREGRLTDVLIDTAGILIGLWLIRAWERRRERQVSPHDSGTSY